MFEFVNPAATNWLNARRRRN